MQNVWIVKACAFTHDPADIIGIYDSEDKALEAKVIAETALDSWGSTWYLEAWVERWNLNETMSFDDPAIP